MGSHGVMVTDWSLDTRCAFQTGARKACSILLFVCLQSLRAANAAIFCTTGNRFFGARPRVHRARSRSVCGRVALNCAKMTFFCSLPAFWPLPCLLGSLPTARPAWRCALPGFLGAPAGAVPRLPEAPAGALWRPARAICFAFRAFRCPQLGKLQQVRPLVSERLHKPGDRSSLSAGPLQAQPA